MENNNELQEMRDSFAILNEKLKTQPIINESLIRATIDRMVSRIKKDARKLILIAAIGALSIFAGGLLANWSWTFRIVTLLFLAIAIAYDHYSHRGLTSKNALNGDLATTRMAAAKLKKRQAQWLWFGIPFLMVWIPWFIHESLAFHSNPKPLLIGAAVGAIIGGIFGIRQYLHTRRAINEIIKEIDSLRNDE